MVSMLITDKIYAPICNIITSQGCVLVFKESTAWKLCQVLFSTKDTD